MRSRSNFHQLLAVVASITLERTVDEGLGRHSNSLTSLQLNNYAKFVYTTGLLSVFAQACAKLSVAFLYERIAPRQDRRGIAILLGCIGAWIVFAIFGTAFTCEGKVYWGARCSSGGWVELPIIITNCLTDGMLALWMVPRLWKLQTSARDRALPILLMGSRILCCAAELGLLGYLAQLRARVVSIYSADSTWTVRIPLGAAISETSANHTQQSTITWTISMYKAEIQHCSLLVTQRADPKCLDP